MNDEECCICFERCKRRFILPCGHDQFHRKCVLAHFKPECPLCKTSHHYKVTGESPELWADDPSIDWDVEGDCWSLFSCFNFPIMTLSQDSTDSEDSDLTSFF